MPDISKETRTVSPDDSRAWCLSHSPASTIHKNLGEFNLFLPLAAEERATPRRAVLSYLGRKALFETHNIWQLYTI